MAGQTVSLENYGNYQLLKRLATGGMAQIYLARSRGPKASNQLVVVKRILPHLGENKEFVQMFLDEAKIAARLAHPNIVAIYDLGAQDDSFFIAMEYIHGEDVRRMCKRAGGMGLELPVPLACRIIIDACAGLDYAHKKTDGGKPLNIVHRDVSPQNILVSFKGEVKVVDFGIAKAADQATVTRSGVLKGKYSYMSPEQAGGKKVDCRSDVFALGVVLYELLTSTRLFKRSSDMQTLAAVAECNVMPPSQVNPRVPPDLDPIVLKALAKDPEARYADALQLQTDLEAWLRNRKLSATNAELAGFLRHVYEERLAREARSGSIVVEEDPPPTGQRTAVEGNRRGSGGNNPSVASGSSKDVTRAERGEQKAAVVAEESIEATDPIALAPRVPAKPSRSIEAVRREPEAARREPEAARREPDAERTRQERQTPPPQERPVPAPRPTVEERRPNLSELPTQALDEKSLALSLTATTQSQSPPRRNRWRGRLIIAGVAATISAVVAALGMWLYLRPLGDKQVPALPPATVWLETVPPGAKVVFEGKLVGITPMKLPPMPAGTHEVVISREGYAEERIAVGVPPTGVLRIEPVSLKPLTPKEQPPPDIKPGVTPPPGSVALAAVQLTLQTEPVQATIFVDGKERGLSPQRVEAKADQELEVKVTAPQYRPLEQRVKVKSGPAQVEVFKLEPLPKPQQPPTVKQTRQDPPKPPPAPAKALVRFVVTPWAEVTCSGKNLGTTPFPDVSLPVGTHQCRFSNPGEGRTLNQSIEVRATALNKVIVNLRDGTVKF
jgi:serine/threonine protein kinase